MLDAEHREVKDAGQHGVNEAKTSAQGSTCFSICKSLSYSTVSCSTTPLLKYPRMQ